MHRHRWSGRPDAGDDRTAGVGPWSQSGEPSPSLSISAERSLAAAKRGHHVAMLLIAAIAVVGLLLLHQLLAAHERDAEIADIAGRQRLLSQTMTTLAVLGGSRGGMLRDAALESLAEWRSAGRRLASGDLAHFTTASSDDEIASLGVEARALDRAVSAHLANRPGSADELRDELLALQSTYVQHLDTIVHDFSEHSRAAMQATQTLGIALAAVLLACMLAESLLIFRPLVVRLYRQIAERARLLDQAQRDARYVRAVRSADVGVWEWNVRTGALHGSAEFSAVTGAGPGAPRSWAELGERFEAGDRARLTHELDRVVRGRDALRFEGRIRLESGATRWVRIEGRVYEERYVAGIVTDIHEHRKQQAERERLLEAHDHQLRLARDGLAEAQTMSAVYSLASGMAHDMNNLLQVVRSSVELIQAGDDDPALLDDIALAVADASAVTEHMLALRPTPAESHRMFAIDRRLADLEPVLAQVVAGPVRFEMDIEQVSGLLVLGSWSQIKRALVNLVVNARDALDGQGQISLRARVLHEGVELVVEDDGRGIPQEHLARVVEPFFSTKTGGRGTGLGLAMVHGCALSHGGSLTFESAPGHGTVARLWLPLASGDAPPGEASSRPAAASPPPASAPTGDLVLLIDDDDRVRAGLQRALISLGFRVQAAAGGEQALEWLRARPEDPAAIVCDVVMPAMLGPDVVRLVRSRLSRDVPVVMVSGNHAADLPVAPPTQFLRKPYAVETLGRVLRDLMARASAPPQHHVPAPRAAPRA